MITPAQRAEIRRLFYGEHWKIGTIAAQLGFHHDTVRAAVERESAGVRPRLCRPSILDYRTSPYKDRIDRIGQRLVEQRYHPEVTAQHLREWLRVTRYLQAQELRLPLALDAPEVAQYVTDRVIGLSASRTRFVWAAVRIFLDADEHGYCRRRIGKATQPAPAWSEPAVVDYATFLRFHRGLAPRTVDKRVWQLTRFAADLDQDGVTRLAARAIATVPRPKGWAPARDRVGDHAGASADAHPGGVSLRRARRPADVLARGSVPRHPPSHQRAACPFARGRPSIPRRLRHPEPAPQFATARARPSDAAGPVVPHGIARRRSPSPHPGRHRRREDPPPAGRATVAAARPSPLFRDPDYSESASCRWRETRSFNVLRGTTVFDIPE